MNRSTSGLRPAFLLLAALSLLLATACLDLAVGIELADDGSGTLRLDLVFDRGVLAQFGQPTDPATVLAEAGIDLDQLPPDTDLEIVDTETEVGARLALPFDAPATGAAGADGRLDLAPAINAAFDALGEDAGTLLGPGGLVAAFSLAREPVAGGDRWTFSATTIEGEPLDAFSALLLGDASLRLHLTLPGSVGANNADSTDGDRLTWEIPFSGQPRTFQATSLVERPGSTASRSLGATAWAALVALAIILAGVALLLFRRR